MFPFFSFFQSQPFEACFEQRFVEHVGVEVGPTPHSKETQERSSARILDFVHAKHVIERSVANVKNVYVCQERLRFFG
jgi:hypothetical protein